MEKQNCKELEYWIWLTQIPWLGAVTAKTLVDVFKDPRTIYNADQEQLSQVHGLTTRQIDSILQNKSMERAKTILEMCDKKRISVLTYENTFYPKMAKCPHDAPIMLYYKGNLRELSNTVGIVGARRCTQKDKANVIEIVKEQTHNGLAVISGMAKGIDSYAHTVCINEGGYTVAVLGNGLDICYPSEHRQLMKRIEETGLLLSEYPPGIPPSRYNFPRRNRIISAWSKRLIVVASGKKSGALITADYAQKYGRNVEVLEPDVIFLPQIE